MFRKLLVLVPFVAVACGSPDIVARAPETEGPTFFAQVVDAEGDVGAGVSITADADGNAHLAYLAFEEDDAEEGPPDPLAPELPAVQHAHLIQGAWTRSVVAEGVDVSPDDQTAIAVDPDGVHHVVWTGGDGLSYSHNAEGGEFSEPETITGARATGPSATAAGGPVRVGFYEDPGDAEGPSALVRVATLEDGEWSVETAAEANPGSLATTGIGAEGDEVLVAYGDGEETLVARSGEVWESEVADPQGGEGVRMAQDGDGNPHLAYFDGDGAVRHAHSIDGGAWETNEVADPGTLPDAGSATIAVDTGGVHHIAWQDAEALGFASNAEGQFEEEEVPHTGGGALPAIAAGADDIPHLAWHDPAAGSVKLSSRTEREPLLARPPAEEAAPGNGEVPPPADCPEPATEMAIEAPPGAALDGFDVECLAAPVGEPLAIEFDNADPQVPHNVAIYTDQTASEVLFQGEIFPGVDSRTYQADPIDEAGNFYYQCDVHATTMVGTFVVE